MKDSDYLGSVVQKVVSAAEHLVLNVVDDVPGMLGKDLKMSYALSGCVFQPHCH